MPEFTSVQAVVTDIEGTTSSISFVHEVLFPYAADKLPAFVRDHGDDPAIAAVLADVAREANLSLHDREALIAQLLQWIRDDKKVTPLKTLQGHIWAAGYQNGAYQAHVYADVAPQLRAWKRDGLDVYVYSSGSVLAQKLFFEFSEAGNLLGLFDGHFDTGVGAKRDPASYQAISQKTGIAPSHILFLSDVVAELEAARNAGFQVCLLVRPGNGEAESHDFPVANAFSELQITPQ